MAFRIDGVGASGDRWYCMFKGVGGEEAFGLLITGPRGEGLQLAEEAISRPGEFLLGPDVFCLPPNSTAAEAEVYFAQALHRLGWGPDVSPSRRRLQSGDGGG